VRQTDIHVGAVLARDKGNAVLKEVAVFLPSECRPDQAPLRQKNRIYSVGYILFDE
jgi:hypothetical protein